MLGYYLFIHAYLFLVSLPVNNPNVMQHSEGMANHTKATQAAEQIARETTEAVQNS